MRTSELRICFLSVLGITLLTMAGCTAADNQPATHVSSPGDDDTVRAAIVKNWQQDHPELVGRISVSVTQSIVLLNGAVATPQQRVDALKATWQTSGVQEVVNEIQVMNSKGSNYVKDDIIAMKIRGKLTFDPTIDSTHYSIEAIKDTIYIMGVAQSEDEKAQVEQLATGVKGVGRVVNYIMVKSAS